MKQYGLLGYPLSHSFSKGYFTEKFSKEGIDAVYNNFSIPSIEDFPELIKAHPDLVGLNVTIPYKQAVIPFLNELNFEAREMGAVNVIRVERDLAGAVRLVGYNSDLVGFRESIRPYITAMGPGKWKALVLGTGGASKAIVYGLKQLGVDVQSVSRTPGANCITYHDLTARHYRSYQIVVNTTPLGMSPHYETYPPLDYSSLDSGHLLFDAVYNPEKTLFLQKGEEQGATIKNGLEMLHLQAEAAWKIWTQ
jgi:shikimate dehydrogenase